MLYKTKLQQDGWGQLLELIYTRKFQKVGLSILDDAKTFVKNSSVYSVIIYIQMNVSEINF